MLEHLRAPVKASPKHLDPFPTFSPLRMLVADARRRLSSTTSHCPTALADSTRPPAICVHPPLTAASCRSYFSQCGHTTMRRPRPSPSPVLTRCGGTAPCPTLPCLSRRRPGVRSGTGLGNAGDGNRQVMWRHALATSACTAARAFKDDNAGTCLPYPPGGAGVRLMPFMQPLLRPLTNLSVMTLAEVCVLAGWAGQG